MEGVPNPVVLYDGECGLCNRVVRLLMRWDRYSNLKYAPLQGPQARRYLEAHGEPPGDLSTVYFVPDWNHQERRDFLKRSEAVAAALIVCGGAPAFFGKLLRLVPRRVRDRAYSAVGHARYRIFGPWRDRPLPNPRWAERILR